MIPSSVSVDDVKLHHLQTVISNAGALELVSMLWLLRN